MFKWLYKKFRVWQLTSEVKELHRTAIRLNLAATLNILNRGTDRQIAEQLYEDEIKK